MRNLFFFIFLTHLVYSCKQEPNYTNDKVLCEILVRMTKDDQSIRSLDELKDPYFAAFDSLLVSKSLTKDEFWQIDSISKNNIKNIAKIVAEKKPKISISKKDSLWEIQNEIDKRNTTELIQIVKERGWPNDDSLQCKEKGSAVLIFRHSLKQFFPEIQELIDIELKKKRIDGLNHMFIDNHLKGRPAFNFTKVEK